MEQSSSKVPLESGTFSMSLLTHGRELWGFKRNFGTSHTGSSGISYFQTVGSRFLHAHTSRFKLYLPPITRQPWAFFSPPTPLSRYGKTCVRRWIEMIRMVYHTRFSPCAKLSGLFIWDISTRTHHSRWYPTTFLYFWATTFLRF